MWVSFANCISAAEDYLYILLLLGIHAIRGRYVTARVQYFV